MVRSRFLLLCLTVNSFRRYCISLREKDLVPACRYLYRERFICSESEEDE